MRYSLTITGIGAIALLALTGCGRADTDDVSTPAATGQTSAPATAGRGVAIDVARLALQTATAAVPNGRPFDMETETDNGQRVLDVKVASNGSEFKVVVGADGKQVVWQKQANTPSDDIAKVDSAKVDAAAALQTAADSEHGSTLSEMEIDTNRAGAVVWQVTLIRGDGSHREVDVDAQSGALSAGI